MRKIFINLPVSDLAASMKFYSAIGFVNNPQFTDETAACMVLSDTIYVMLLTHNKFSEFTPLPISDATRATEVLIALSCDSQGEVHAHLAKALGAGGKEFIEPRDYGFMFSRSYHDLDGHIWEIFWMDPSAIQPDKE